MQIYNPALDTPCFQEALKPYTIHVVAPSSGIHPEKIACLKTLNQFKLNWSFTQLESTIPYHSNSDELRFNQLRDALLDDSNSIIWALRGGYGSARLIEKLSTLPVPLQKKSFIGFSDITALHLFFSQRWQWPCIHASGLAQILDPNQDEQNFIKMAAIVAKTVAQTSIEFLKPLNQRACSEQIIQGHVTGGNLTLVENSIGTLWQIQTEQKIVFLEEVGEKAYRIDRSLYHLYQAGLLKNVQALIFGECSHQSNGEDILVALKRFAYDQPIPIYQCNQFGHGNINHPLVYNAPAVIRRKKNQADYELLMRF